jgi:hypothetical protein
MVASFEAGDVVERAVSIEGMELPTPGPIPSIKVG